MPAEPSVRDYATPVNGPSPAGAGDLAWLFPTQIPAVEQIIYQRVRDACSSRALFPLDGGGITLPAAFSVPPDISKYAGQDSSYTRAGKNIRPIEVTRGWPAYPAEVPQIGVAESTSNSDGSADMLGGGFAGDVFAYDAAGNVLATASYYAEPLQIAVAVELIHENRDERDRLHDQLRRVIYPLRRIISNSSPLVRDVHVDSEKQDLPQDELPRPIYVSLYTVTVTAEALIPSDITPYGVISEIDVTVTPITTE